MPDRILPELWLYHPVIAKLPDDCFAFLTRVALRMDDYNRVGIGTSPEEPDLLCSLLHPMNRRVQVSDVARRLAFLKAAGAILIRNSERGWYLQVNEEILYQRSEVKQPKWGEKIEPKLEQGHLPIGPVPLLAVPKGKKKGSAGLNHSCSESKAETKANLPGAASPVKVLKDSLAVAQEGGAQSDEEKRKAGYFSAGEWSIPGDDAWKDLCGFLNEGQFTSKEMWDNGKQWVRLFQAERGLVVDAVLQGLTLDKEKHHFDNRGAWLNDQIAMLRKRRSA